MNTPCSYSVIHVADGNRDFCNSLLKKKTHKKKKQHNTESLKGLKFALML